MAQHFGTPGAPVLLPPGSRAATYTGRVRPAPPDPVVSLTLHRYGGRSVWRGFGKMGTDHLHLRGVPGLTFYRLLGTGRGADLTLGADLRRWARLAVWSSRAALERFEASPWRRWEARLVDESYTLVLRPVRWHGRWGGVEPFGPAAAGGEDTGGPLAVLTRATLRPARLTAFWGAVPTSQQGLHGRPGLLASLGLGEFPLLHQATFSLWRDAASMRAYAYGQAGHREVIARTRREGWYREELFARFAILAAGGSWDGRDPLAGLLPG